MNHKRFNPIAFYRELRRRRVFQVALLYGVGAWGVIAACDVLLPQLTNWVADPDRAMRVVFIAAIALFPVALVFGWLYDVTADGIQRTASFSGTVRDPDTSLHPVDRGIIGTLSALVIGVLVASTVHIMRMEPPDALNGTAAGPAIPEHSIAVLPFEVCDGPGADPLLAAGIASETLRYLAEIPNLKVTAKSLLVIARASSFALANMDMEPRQIASTLRVRHLLSGTVCRDGDALTVAAELVDESGYLVWSHHYTEQMDAAGQVTRPLAALLAAGVAEGLGVVMPTRQDEPVDRLAHEQVLIGREYAQDEDFDKARSAFEAALEHKPDYAEAIFELAMLLWPNQFGESGQSAKLERSMMLAERALAMARHDLQRHPNSAQAHHMAGTIMYRLIKAERQRVAHTSIPADQSSQDDTLAQAERHLRRAVELNPSDSAAWLNLFYATEEEGREREALAVLEKGIERDPLHAGMNGQLATALARQGRYEEALALLDRFRPLPDVDVFIWQQMFRVNLMRGRSDEYVRSMIAMLEHKGHAAMVQRGDGPDAWVSSLGYYLRRFFELSEEGEAWLTRLAGILPQWYQDFRLTEDERQRRDYEQASRMTDEEILDQGIWAAEAMLRALRFAGEYDRAIRLAEVRAKESLMPSSRTWAPGYKLQLAAVYMEAGRPEEAAAVFEELSEALEALVLEGQRAAATLEWLAIAQSYLGQVDAAVSTLQLSEASGNGIILNFCHHPHEFSKVLDPYTALRRDPRFQQLHDRCMSEWGRQREAVRAMLADRDLDVLLAPWIERAAEERGKEQ
jgi:TolB-like protein/Flp pilus assembly protein TadD